MPDAVSLVTLTTDPAQFERTAGTLRAQQPAIDVECLPIDANSHGWNASQGLNDGIERASNDWVVCAHQDVLFPTGWWQRVCAQLDAYRDAANVAVMGLVGMTRAGHFRGHIIDPHGHCYWPGAPCPVIGIDEHVIIVRKSAGVRFDPALPHFHCYGTDIALTASERGKGAIVVDAPVVHLSGGKLDDNFTLASEHLLRKWKARTRGVIPTCAVLLYDGSISGFPRYAIARLARRQSRRALGGGSFRAAYSDA
jgi:hypothetical protein